MNDKGILTMGVDVGGSYVKTVLMRYDQATGDHRLLDRQVEKIRKRNPKDVVVDAVAMVLERNALDYERDIAYLASTGEGELVERKTGHFYSMTTHARGGLFLCPDARTVVDMGALYVRAISIDERGRVLDYKMTGQCASGSGQFIENISRYLGLSIDEVGPISLKSDKPELPSGICAVLAETDVINSVSRGVSTPNIIKGIHLSIANRSIRLLSSLKAQEPVALMGGIAMNIGMVDAMEELSREGRKPLRMVTHPDAIYSGAIGAALWGGYRHHRIKDRAAVVAA
ncbi:MAG: benzoyl-CoA reductase subunit D [Flavobacteriales bacterium]|nr:Benzoyl-CoA reductase subunit D [Flavobacteriales bacterium]MCC6578500.1 benzoyl-CoA reductase subunit D [Flavobacteriales bacterium]